MSEYGIHYTGNDNAHNVTTTPMKPMPHDLAARLRVLAEMHEVREPFSGPALVNYTTGGLESPTVQATLTAQDLRIAADALDAQS